MNGQIGYMDLKMAFEKVSNKNYENYRYQGTQR